MGESDLGSLQRESGKRLLGEEGRGGEQRVNGRADVVRKAGKRQLLGATAAARSVCPLVHVHCESSTRKREGGGETVGAGADDDCVRCAHRRAACTHLLESAWLARRRKRSRAMLTIAARCPVPRQQPRRPKYRQSAL